MRLQWRHPGESTKDRGRGGLGVDVNLIRAWAVARVIPLGLGSGAGGLRSWGILQPACSRNLFG
eukprot:5899716-Prorocentrum_lima.AAC.1